MALFIRTFPKELQKKLKIKAVEKGQSLTSLIIEILKKWLEKEK
jgi:plasmid stability protein